MTLLITPLLVFGLLFSASPQAGQCTDATDNGPADCSVNAGAARIEDDPGIHLERQARKHEDYYLLLVRGQQDASADQPKATLYSARSAYTDSASTISSQ